MEGKLAIIDDRWMTLGTANLDGFSMAAFETEDNSPPANELHGGLGGGASAAGRATQIGMHLLADLHRLLDQLVKRDNCIESAQRCRGRAPGVRHSGDVSRMTGNLDLSAHWIADESKRVHQADGSSIDNLLGAAAEEVGEAGGGNSRRRAHLGRQYDAR